MSKGKRTIPQERKIQRSNAQDNKTQAQSLTAKARDNKKQRTKDQTSQSKPKGKRQTGKTATNVNPR
jgi:hypothetical protein